jgi:hypothetical protein
MNAGATQVGRKHVHEMQPYGWVEMVDCVVEEREVPDYGKPVEVRTPGWSWGTTTYPHTRKATFVVGTVSASSYCGALWCGVAVSKPNSDRYPVGSRHECEIKRPSDLENGRTIYVAM